MADNDRLRELIAIIEQAVALLPDTSQSALKKELSTIRELIMNARAPRLMIVGRRGAGKSSLVNAIFGEKIAEIGSVSAQTAYGHWHRYQSGRGMLNILDTRGLGDFNRPAGAQFQNALDEIKKELSSDYPDVMLFLCKAKDVDSHLGEDFRNIQAIRAYIRNQHSYEVPVMAVVTQVDELDPVDVTQPPYDDPDKQAHIQKAVTLLKDAFEQQKSR
ncbi:MAG: ATP-binding cassette domain-containing protein [Bacteroidia bacterium]|nr:ATP-binding cassette domain-containing protein [Bacteroidia bacterium]